MPSSPNDAPSSGKSDGSSSSSGLTENSSKTGKSKNSDTTKSKNSSSHGKSKSSDTTKTKSKNSSSSGKSESESVKSKSSSSIGKTYLTDKSEVYDDIEPSASHPTKVRPRGSFDGEQAPHYEVGELVFVKHCSFMWPGRIEPKMNSPIILTKYHQLVFLYGIHERLAIPCTDIYLFAENMGAFGKITGHEILNKALAECANDPDIVYRRQPMHLYKGPCMLRRSPSHIELLRKLEGHNDNLDEFSDRRFISQDKWYGCAVIILAAAFLLYLTIWIILLPFAQPGYEDIIEELFPRPHHAIVCPMAAGAMMSCAVLAFVGALFYRPRLQGRQWMVVTKETPANKEDRMARLEEFVSWLRKHRPAISILLVSAMIFMGPLQIFAVCLIVFGGCHLLRDFLMNV